MLIYNALHDVGEEWISGQVDESTSPQALVLDLGFVRNRALHSCPLITVSRVS